MLSWQHIPYRNFTRRKKLWSFWSAMRVGRLQCGSPVGIAESLRLPGCSWKSFSRERRRRAPLHRWLFRAFSSGWEFGWTRPQAACSEGEVSPAWSRRLDERAPSVPPNLCFSLILSLWKNRCLELVSFNSLLHLKMQTNVDTDSIFVSRLGIVH